MIDYQMGTEVRFRTLKRTIFRDEVGDEIIEWCGRVNGETIAGPDARYIPVWCDRVGKERTTIVVSEGNILPR